MCGFGRLYQLQYDRMIVEPKLSQVQEGARPVHLHGQRGLQQSGFSLTATGELASLNVDSREYTQFFIRDGL